MTAVAATSYIYALSAKRLLTQGGASITTSLDWEWGRFSMVGFSSDVVSREGLLLGETYLSGLNQFLAGILGLLGLTLQDQAGRGASQVAGEYILASTDAYIVPGLVSEALLNFGGVGAIIALAALGFASKWVQKSISECTDPIALLLWAYIGALLVFRTLNADSWSLPTYFLYSGAPLIAAFASTRASRSGHIASATQLMPSSP
ncbi:hypothetical protein [Timonella senegalensis]|uniref:hypothetical protein n=1 Tax=Timonella senegalensis TaxID=1465825 RepID=UPI0028AAF295|nr:hypothetical protein [Timonella senegalensis]